MEKCSAYHTHRSTIYSDYGLTTTTQEYGVCYGTKECERCSCGGNKIKCDFYLEIRQNALKETNKYKIHEAIKFLSAVGYKVIKVKEDKNDYL